MMNKILSPKIISDPIRGTFDIRSVLPMIDTPQFQSLANKRQLGMTYLAFPSATHTRMAHSFGSFDSTRELTKRWCELGLINQEEATAVNAFALYHDIGHGPFSHVTERLCPLDNDGMGLKIIDELKSEIEACNVNFDLFKDIFAHKNKLYLAVHDKNLGMEKLDYLERDALFTVGKPSGMDYLKNYIDFTDNNLVVDQKVIDNVKRIQNFYMEMYKNVYLRKISMIGQRMIQKMVYGLIMNNELTLEELPQLDDYELMGKLSIAKNPLVNYLYDLLKNRDLFKEAVVIRYKEFAATHRTTGKKIHVFGADSELMNRLIKSLKINEKNPDFLLKTEKTIARIANIPVESVLIVPVISPERFEAEDIRIKNSKKTLKKLYPAHYENMVEYGRTYASLRICTPAKYRKKLSRKNIAQKVYDQLLSDI